MSEEVSPRREAASKMSVREELKKFDLNSLFQLTYQFDLLKTLIEKLAEDIDSNNCFPEVQEIRRKLRQQNKQIADYETKLEGFH